jgi:hypothetical protein
MLIKNKKHFATGVVLAISFFGLFFLLMSPVFGNGKNGLQYADDIFNKLSKGSSYFAPKVTEHNEKFIGKQFSVNIKFNNPEEAKISANLFTIAGANVESKENTLKIEGDLGRVLSVVIRDADLMYKNEGDKVNATYGYDEKKVMKDWWTTLSKIDKAFKTDKQFDNAKMVSEVYKKVVEPGYNFYKIEAQQVTDRIGTMSGLLIFYVIYTMWWGFALYHLFEGIGLTTKKVQVKKEI